MVSKSDVAPATQRRRLLRLGLAASAALAALRLGSAFADDDDNGRDDGRGNRNGDGPGNGNGNGRQQPGQADDEQNGNPRGRLPAISTALVLASVSEVVASGDFVSASAGTDPLGQGRLAVFGTNGSTDNHARVQLRGAGPNVSYDVFFVRATNIADREPLGTIGPTNASGNLDAVAPIALPIANRSGIFLLSRHDGDQAGQDEFVSCIRRMRA